MLLENNTLDLIEKIDSVSPTPGGGSVSALVSVLGISLARMYGHLSINKKKFKALEENAQNDFIERFNALVKMKEQLQRAIDHDCDAYDEVMCAYKLPKTTDVEIENRQQAILKATYLAIESPYNIMEESLKAMELCKDMVEYGNTNAISDLACGVIFLDSAIQGAGLNVLINLGMLENKEKEVWTFKMNHLLSESVKIKEDVIYRVKQIIEN